MQKLCGGQLLLVLDDLMAKVAKNEEAGNLFTCARHMHCSVLFISQNLFKQGPASRDILLNTNYLMLFQNQQDAKQIACFAQRLQPQKWRQLLEIYQDATAIPFGYLLLDLRVGTHPLLKFRGRIGPSHQLLYSLDPTLGEKVSGQQNQQ